MFKYNTLYTLALALANNACVHLSSRVLLQHCLDFLVFIS